MAPRTKGGAGKCTKNRDSGEFDENSEEYRAKRDRNNVAVKKSREKTRQKSTETLQKVSRLKADNKQLEMKITLLSKELSLLKDLFLAHAGSVALGQCTHTGCDGSHSDGGGGSPSHHAPMVFEPMEVKSERRDSSDHGPEVNTEALRRDHEYTVPESKLEYSLETDDAFY